MAKAFMREKTDMPTTEPSVDEVRMSRKVKKPMMPAKPMMPRMAKAGLDMMEGKDASMSMLRRKKGGEVESKAHQKMEDKRIGKVEKELKKHEGKPASKGHKGLKTGGVAKYATGGVVQKYATGGVVQKFADGGHACMTTKSEGGFTAKKKMCNW